MEYISCYRSQSFNSHNKAMHDEYYLQGLAYTDQSHNYFSNWPIDVIVVARLPIGKLLMLLKHCVHTTTV